MREHHSTSLFMALVFLMGLAGCVADSTKSPSDAVATSAVVQAEEGKDQPPTGEIQERGVLMPRPGIVVPRPVGPPPLAVLPGAFALETWVGSGVNTINFGTPEGLEPGLDQPSIQASGYGPGTPHYLTAVKGGGQITDVVHTDATQARAWEQLRLLFYGNGQYALQTVSGYYVTAVNSGGLTTNAIHTDASKVGAWELFRLRQQQDSGTYAIQTSNGINYLTAAGGGGKTTDAIHTDHTKVESWEAWRLVKSGDLGSGYCYGIQPFTGFYLSAPQGGGRTTEAILAVSPAMGPLHSPERFRLMRQADGSYAIQTANGSNYVTAVNGGGLVQGSTTWNILQTDRTQVQAWEKFRFVDQGDGSYAIQTVSGYYLGLYPTAGVYAFTTDRSIIGPGEKFKLIWCDPLS
jgi:hypothetical protein